MATNQKTESRSGKQTMVLLEETFSEPLIEHPITKKYSDRINNKLRADYGVIEEIVSHNPSIGNYYERILSANLEEYLPSAWRLATGFVFDDLQVKTSPQIDLLVYRDNELAPIFRVGDLVVVRPEQVVGIIEVKKNLKLGDIDDLVEKYLFSNTGSEYGARTGIQFVNIFSYEQSALPIKFFERTVLAIEKKLEKLRDPKNPNFIHGVLSLTLPRIYFLDANHFISSLVRKEGQVERVEVSLLGIPYSSGGASDLFSRFIWHSDDNYYGKLRLTTTGLYEPIQDRKIEIPVVLREYIPCRKFFSVFSDSEMRRIKKDMIKQTLGFSAPYGAEIRTFDQFEEALKNKTIAPLPIKPPEDQ